MNINKNIVISISIFVILCIFLVRHNKAEPFQDINVINNDNEDKLFGNKKQIDDTILDEDTLVAYQDFTKFAIKGDRGEVGEKGDQGGRGIQGVRGIIGEQGESLTGSIKSTGKLWLGSNNKGKSGINSNGEIQLYLGGIHGQGANNGRGGQTTYKLKIDGYDNTGSTVFPIHCSDKNGNVDMYLKNRQSSSTKPLLNVSGDIRLESSKSILDCRGNITCIGSLTCNGIIKSKNTLEGNNLSVTSKAVINELTSTKLTSTNWISDKGTGIYFQNPNSNYTGWSRKEGHCSIQNGKNYKCLMLLGRSQNGTRKVGIWDHLTVNGSQNVTGDLNVSKNTTLSKRLISKDHIRMNGNGIVFDNVNSNYTGLGNKTGYACIENGKNFNSLMILGRYQARGPDNWSTGSRRQVSIWDDCYIHNDLKVRYQIWCLKVNQRSDRNFKKNISQIKDPFRILKLKGVSFNWKNMEENTDINKLEYGLIAQDVEKVIPELVSGREGKKNVNYIGTIPFLIETIKQQQAQISKLKDKNDKLDERIKILENIIFKFT